jgi:branched-chain amino acid transport system permease protein
MALPIGEIIIYGLALGGAYALMATSFSFIYGVARLLNMAHGTFFTLTGYFVWIFINWLDINPYLSIIFSLIVMFFFGLAVWYIVSPLTASFLGVLMVTFAISFTVESLLNYVFGAATKSIPSLIGGTTSIFGVEVISQYLVMLGASLVTLFCLMTFLTRTTLGTAIRAVAQDREASMLNGVNSNQINTLVMGVATILAGIAAVLILPVQTLGPFVGMTWLMKAWVIVVLGGLGSLKGSTVASFIIAFIEMTLIMGVAGGGYIVDVLYVVIVLLVLFIRPTGMFGRPIRGAH